MVTRAHAPRQVARTELLERTVFILMSSSFDMPSPFFFTFRLRYLRPGPRLGYAGRRTIWHGKTIRYECKFRSVSVIIVCTQREGS